MRITKILSVAFLFVILPLTAAWADNYSPGWYVSAGAGAYMRDDQDGNTTVSQGITSGPASIHEEFDTGELFNAAIGYKFPNHLRLEGEAGYIGYGISSINPSSASFATLRGQSFNQVSGGDFTRYTGTVNAYYDIPLGNVFAPYFGGGIGLAYGDASNGTFRDAAGNTFIGRGGSELHGVSFLEAGLSIAITNNIALVPAYRYYHFFDDSTNTAEESANVVKLGVRYSF